MWSILRIGRISAQGCHLEVGLSRYRLHGKHWGVHLPDDEGNYREEWVGRGVCGIGVLNSVQRALRERNLFSENEARFFCLTLHPHLQTLSLITLIMRICLLLFFVCNSFAVMQSPIAQYGIQILDLGIKRGLWSLPGYSIVKTPKDNQSQLEAAGLIPLDLKLQRRVYKKAVWKLKAAAMWTFCQFIFLITRLHYNILENAGWSFAFLVVQSIAMMAYIDDVARWVFFHRFIYISDILPPREELKHIPNVLPVDYDNMKKLTDLCKQEINRYLLGIVFYFVSLMISTLWKIVLTVLYVLVVVMKWM